MLASRANAAPELEHRRQVDMAAQAAVASSDFAALDKLANEFRTTKVRTESGLWMLTLLDVGIRRGLLAEQGASEEPDVAFAAIERKTAKWTRLYPASPSGHIAHANILLKHAWAYRSRGHGGHEDPKDLAAFHAYVSKARAHLERHRKVASVDPRWFQTMINVANAQNWERAKFEHLLADAIDQEPLFYETYFSALEFLLPKCHGDIDQIEKFAQNAATRTRATEGRGMYARIYWYASQARFNTRLFEDSKVNWPRLRDGFDDVVARYPDSWNLSNYAKFACLAGDKAKAQALFQRMGDNVANQAWGSARDRDECESWAEETVRPGA